MALSLVGTDFRRSQDQKGFTVGTVEKYKTEAHALKAEEGVRLMINDGMLRREQVLFCGILDRFLIDQKQAEDAEQITHSTLASYRSMICKHIRPKWGDNHLENVGPALVQEWLRKLFLSPKYTGTYSIPDVSSFRQGDALGIAEYRILWKRMYAGRNRTSLLD